MRFFRSKYLQQLLAGRGNGMVKIVTGVRRCGKSYLLFDIFRAYLLDEGVSEDHIIMNCGCADIWLMWEELSLGKLLMESVLERNMKLTL